MTEFWRGRNGRRVRWAVIGLTALVAVVLLGAGANTLGRYFGWTTERLTPQEASALLSPYYRITKPEGAGPFPTALIFSGCDGPQDNMARWAERLAAEGWASIVVDSHTPRGFDDYDIWRLICVGQLFMGSERAGDVLIGIDDARKMDFVDTDRIALIGASHGGWSIMDFFVLDPPETTPFSLSALPESFAARGMEGIVGSVLVYPWCGPANRARSSGWRDEAPVLFLLSREDAIAPSGECLDIAEVLEKQGKSVETVVFEGTTHGFDQKTRAAFSLLEFNAEATETALATAVRFLNEAAGLTPGG
ncbi:dienelactone hydrolase family protein [Acuticoccus kandeliae]|uniref:dienelactone hydrolase family protein n=1 Tax=Acuticoccus kandeliae TaxID=2073160 RepID=UPI001FE3987F|nr:dienelactone hydrolase family protein [Acuticoccus kandeliae]